MQIREIYKAANVPLLQNRVYPSKAEAERAGTGTLTIVQDIETGFIYNSSFQSDLVKYDSNYDNCVPSGVFDKYYDEVADYLHKQFTLDNSTVLDVGCGKGTFLVNLCKRHSSVNGHGIDPSYEGPLKMLGGRISFINEYLSVEYLQSVSEPKLVICRHVLEHIEEPVRFLRSLFAPLKAFGKNISLFFEVPDVEWIIRERAFWDFCYEHVNYFDRATVSAYLTKAGATVTNVTPSFNGQYLWVEAILGGSDYQPVSQEKAVSYDVVKLFVEEVSSSAERIRKLDHIVIWGMATKGVMLSLQLKNHGINIEACVDINKNKQGKFVPVSGVEIISPELLSSKKNYSIICMNPNYQNEVRELCSQLGINARFYDGRGLRLEELTN